MKNQLLTLVLVFLSYSGLSQYNYFDWKRQSTTIVNQVKSAGSGIAVDSYNRCFYIANSNKKVCWQWGEVLSTAPVAHTRTNLVHFPSTSGDAIFYKGSDAKLKCIVYSYSTSSWLIDNVYSIDQLATDCDFYVESKDKIFYVKSNLALAAFWRSGSNFGTTILTAPLSAAGWSNIVVKGDYLYYVANNSKLACLKWNYSTNVFEPYVINSETIATGSRISLKANSEEILYVRASDNRIGHFWKTATNSFYDVVSSDAIPAMTGTNIFSMTEKEIIYTGTDGDIHNLYSDENAGVIDNTLFQGCGIVTTNPNLAISADKKVFYPSGNNIYSLESQQSTGFPYVKGTRIMEDGQNYNALIMDYNISYYRLSNGTIFIGPDTQYDASWSDWVCLNPTACNTTLNSHLQQIASMGFNTIRFSGTTVLGINTAGSPNIDPKLYTTVWDIPASGSLPYAQTTLELTPALESQLLTVTENLVNLAGSKGLKSSLCPGMKFGNQRCNQICHPTYQSYLGRYGNYFKNNDNIFLVNIMFEADFAHDYTMGYSLYGSTGDADKAYICETVNDFYDEFRSFNKKHLISISLISPFSLSNWDPGTMKMDVATYHIYPDCELPRNNYNYENYYRNNQWFSNIIHDKLKKPWVVGEIGIPALPGTDLNNTAQYPYITQDGHFNLVVPYEVQRSFGLMSLNNTFASGASGYGWWEYHDTHGTDNYGHYFGVVSNNNTLKPIVAPGTSIFSNYTPPAYSGPTIAADYYSQANSYTYNKSGRILDGDNGNRPVKDAFIVVNSDCLTPNVYKSYSTFSDVNGYFTIKSPCPITEMRIHSYGDRSKVVTNPVTGTPNYIVYDLACSYQAINQLEEDLYIEYNSTETKTGLVSTEEMLSYEIFPNPVDDLLMIKSSQNVSGTLIRIYSIEGKFCGDYTFEGLELTIDLTHLNPGIYFVQIENSKFGLQTRELIKK